MTYFAVFMVMMMLIMGGMAVDLMQNEMERTRIQATLDRAILAAADLDQTLDPKAVVNDYFDKSGMSQYLANVEVQEGLNFRTVTATASSASTTQFMHLLGVDELPVPAAGAAEERKNKVEISMVLDISGSMGNNNKMANLQTAAKTFVDTVLIDENDDRISLSLVPYTTNVNPGPAIFNELLVNVRHPYSRCIDFVESDFNSVGLNQATRVYNQSQYFEWSGAWYGWAQTNQANLIQNPGCPKRSAEEIVTFSQDPNALKATIDQYRARARTSIHVGMKWGVAMLDPSFRPIVQTMSNAGTVDGIFASRPASYSDDETLKTVILMTDGKNVDTYRIANFVYSEPSHYAHWSNYPFLTWINNRVSSSQRSSWYDVRHSAGQADNMLNSICSAAKNQGIVVWSIGFEVSDHSANVMRNCASTASHFFRVEGTEISDAFESIAKQINELRLTL